MPNQAKVRQRSAGGVRSAGRRGRRAGRAGARTRVRQGGEAPDESARPGGSARAAEPRPRVRGVSQPGQPAVPRGASAEALETYKEISKTSARGDGAQNAFPKHAARVRVNAGNVHYASGEFPAAIKQYRMGARPRLRRRQGDARQDHAQRRVRLRAHGAVHGRGVHLRGRRGFKRRRCGELERRRRKRRSPDVVTLFNLVVCHYATGDAEKMRRAFLALLSLRAYESDEEDEERAAIDAAVSENALVALRETAETGDALRAELRERRRAARGTSSCARRVWWGPRSPPPPSSGTRCWRTRCARRGTPRSRTSWRWPRRWGTCA